LTTIDTRHVRNDDGAETDPTGSYRIRWNHGNVDSDHSVTVRIVILHWKHDVSRCAPRGRTGTSTRRRKR